MNYDDKDKRFQSEIREAIFLRWTINANKEANTIRFFGNFDDKVNPSLTLTLQEIKAATGREKARAEPILRDYQGALDQPFLDIERQPDRLIIRVLPPRSSNNEFGSVRDLMKKNGADLEKDPDLGDAPWD